MVTVATHLPLQWKKKKNDEMSDDLTGSSEDKLCRLQFKTKEFKIRLEK